ncbi:hypothetical protein [Flavobacterium sp.]|uniref:hypothetical protein n=1 Tax=Flavobacterium sp. TaxID=239 RepID=UPI002FD95843
MKKSNEFIFVLIFLSFKMLAQNEGLLIDKMTAINPTSYTDVVYVGSRDTAVISTYSGRLSKIIKNQPGEKIITNLNDEIYSLAYNNKRKEIAASTMEGGIKIINLTSGKIIKTIPLKTTWSNLILYSDDFNYLLAHDVKGNRYIWDVTKNYKTIEFPSKIPNGRIFQMTDESLLKIITNKNLYTWNYNEDKLQKIDSINIKRFGDIDEHGNILSVDFNTCYLFENENKKNKFEVKHPNWLRYYKDFPKYEIYKKQNPNDFTDDGYLIMEGYHMQLTMVRFIKDKICTASIDRSIRVWDKSTGNLIDSLTGHKGTVNKIKVNNNNDQLVSVDLKGGIKFWDF